MIISAGGTLRKSIGTATTGLTGVTFNNSGTVQVQSGTLTISGGTSSGKFDASTAGAIVSFVAGIHTLQNGASLLGPGIHRVNGSTASLTVSGAAGANRFELVSGTVNTSATLTISNTFSWSGGTLGGSGTILLPVGSTTDINGSVVKVLNGPTLNNAGTVTWTGIGGIQFPGGILQNQAGAVFDVQNGEAITDTDGPATDAVIQNAGTLRKTVATTPTTLNSVLLDNTGLVEVQSGTLSLAGGDSSGLFTTTVPGALITFASGNHVLDTGAAVTGPGLCRLTGSGTTLTVSGNVGIDRMEFASGTMTGTGTLTITNSMDWLAGTFSGAGTTAFAPGSAFNLPGASGRTLSGRTLLNRGTATWTGTGNLVFNSGIFQNAIGAIFEAQNDRSFSDNDGGATPALFINEGTFRKTVGTGTTAFNGVLLNNSGLIDVQSGTLALGGGTSTGSFSASSPAAVLSFASGTNILNSGAAFQGSGSFNLSGGSAALNVEGNVSAPRFDLSAGTLAGAGTLTVNGPFNWSGGVMGGAGSLAIPASATLNVNAPFGLTLAGRTINNSGKTVWSGASDITFSSGVFNNLPGSVFEIQNDRGISDNDGVATAALFRNSGTIQKTGASGQTTLFNVALTNTGSINITNWSLSVNGPFSNDGTCTIAAGTINIQGDGSSSGLFATLTPASRISFFSGNQQWRDGARFVGLGTNEIQFCTIDVTGAVGIDNLELVGGAGTITGTGTLNVSNSFRWTFGSMSGTGSTTILPPATLWLTGNGARVLDGRTLNNRGTAHFGGTLGSISFNRGTFNNDTGALCDISVDTAIDDSDGAVTPSLFINAGILRCTGTSGLTTINTLPLTNSGSIQVLSGTLQIGGPFFHSGVCGLTNATLTLSGGGASSGTFNLDSASTLDFSVGDLSLNPGTAFAGGGLVRLSGATLTIPASLPISRFQQNGGTLTGAGTVTIGNFFNWLAGIQAGSGVTLISAGASFNITNNGASALNGRTLRNGGKAVVTGSPLSQGIAFNSGVIENLANATFEVQSDGGFFDQDGPPSVPEFRNAGTFFRTAGGIASFTGVAVTNSGSVVLDSGGSQFGNYTQTAGSTALAGTMTALGVNLTGGTLSGAGSIQCSSLVNSALISPGASAGSIFIFGPYVQTSQGRLSIELGGTTSSLFDSLQISGAATLQGQLDISFINGYQPALSDFFNILTATLVSGEFDTVTGGTVTSSKALRPDYDTTSVLLTVQDATNSTTKLTFSQPVLKPNGDLELTLNGTANATFTLQASTNFLNWVNLISATNPGPSFIYTVTNVSAFPARFFRAR